MVSSWKCVSSPMRMRARMPLPAGSSAVTRACGTRLAPRSAARRAKARTKSSAERMPVEGTSSAAVPLARANFGSGNEAKAFDSIFLAALLQREQLRLFLGLRRNDELPRMAVRDVVPLAKFIIETVAFHAEARLQ